MGGVNARLLLDLEMKSMSLLYADFVMDLYPFNRYLHKKISELGV